MRDKALYSLHCELASRAGKDFVSHDDFLSATPPILVAPHVAPTNEVGHWQH